MGIQQQQQQLASGSDIRCSDAEGSGSFAAYPMLSTKLAYDSAVEKNEAVQVGHMMIKITCSDVGASD